MGNRVFRLVSLLGTSPGTPHTTACKLLERNVELAGYTIVATVEAYARESAAILQECPCPSTGKPPAKGRPEIVVLPFQDVDSQERIRQLRRILSGLLSRDSILDITGGRKLMAVAAVLEALPRGVSVVATVIPNELYEEVRGASSPCGKTMPQYARLVVLT